VLQCDPRGRSSRAGALLLSGCLLVFTGRISDAADFDHTYAGYGSLLTTYVVGDRIDYARLTANRSALDGVVTAFAAVTRDEEAGWSRPRRMAYWINAYNLFTLRAIVDHYPIRGRWLSLYPKNSIRQIDGVWTDLQWNAAGRRITLDAIEHSLLRPEFQDPRVHFALTCASLGCPPLTGEPYTGDELDAHLDRAAVRYLASPRGLVVAGTTLQLSSIFKWYGNDFDARFSALGPAGRTVTDRALLAVAATYGPPAARTLARQASTRIAYLAYDWTLNDTTTQ
jgi:hypothetical protein